MLFRRLHKIPPYLEGEDAHPQDAEQEAQLRQRANPHPSAAPAKAGRYLGVDPGEGGTAKAPPFRAHALMVHHRLIRGAPGSAPHIGGRSDHTPLRKNPGLCPSAFASRRYTPSRARCKNQGGIFYPAANQLDDLEGAVPHVPSSSRPPSSGAEVFPGCFLALS